MNSISREDRDLQRVAQAIADGAEVDWQDISLSRGDLKTSLERLRVIEKIRSVHHSASDSATRPEDTPTRPVLVQKPEKGNGKQAGPALPLGVPETWGPLHILERIGCGGYGEVFRAHDSALQKDVALKLMHAWSEVDENCGIDEQFLNEGRRLASVRHENVLTVHGAARHDGRVGMWTDLVEGHTLEQCLANQGPLGHREASGIGLDLCRALAAVHHRNLVHGDIKASNVMREAGSGKMILMDFSSVRERRATASQAGTICGTPIYMAPEVLRGANAEITSDIYSLGVLLYRLVSGRFPIEADSLRALADKLTRGERVPLREVRPDLPRDFIQVIERAIANDPADRYQSVADMERDLAKVFENPQPRRANRWFLAAATVVIGIALLPFINKAINRPFEVKAALKHVTELGHQVLDDGARVNQGDELFLQLDSNKEMYVYVINSSETGDDFALFPLADLELKNPLPAGTHRLPGAMDGVPRSWEIGTPSGRETILVVASVLRLPEVESSLKRMRQAQAGGIVQKVADSRRSITTHVPRTEPQDFKSVMKSIITTITDEAPGQKDAIFVWQRRLVHAGG